MTSLHENVDEIMRLAASDPRLSVQTAQMFMRVGVELSRLNERLNGANVAMANQYLRHESQIAELRKEIARLKGVHGA